MTCAGGAVHAVTGLALALWSVPLQYEAVCAVSQDFLEYRKERGKMLLSRRNQLLLEFSFWNEPVPRDGPNIYELRSYQLRVSDALFSSALLSCCQQAWSWMRFTGVCLVSCSPGPWLNGATIGKRSNNTCTAEYSSSLNHWNEVFYMHALLLCTLMLSSSLLNATTKKRVLKSFFLFLSLFDLFNSDSAEHKCCVWVNLHLQIAHIQKWSSKYFFYLFFGKFWLYSSSTVHKVFTN